MDKTESESIKLVHEHFRPVWIKRFVHEIPIYGRQIPLITPQYGIIDDLLRGILFYAADNAEGRIKNENGNMKSNQRDMAQHEYMVKKQEERQLEGYTDISFYEPD